MTVTIPRILLLLGSATASRDANPGEGIRKKLNLKRGEKMEKLIQWFRQVPEGTPKSVILIRFMAGGVFFWEGILKFVYTNQGVGRFTKLGIPFPDFTAHFVANLEIVGGLLLIFGFLTRWICVPFIIEMIVAILSTKISLYLGTYPLPLPPAPPQVGIWAVLHEIRSDYAQIVCSIFLLLVGPGAISLDRKFFGGKKSTK
jgi:putative oxidoreductase